MSRLRWPVFLLIAIALAFGMALPRPIATSARPVSQAGTPEVTETPTETPTPTPTETPISEPTLESTPTETPTGAPTDTPTPEPTFTPTPLPTPVLIWDSVTNPVSLAAGGVVTLPLHLRVEQADVAQLNFSAVVSDTSGFSASIDPTSTWQMSAGGGVDLVLTIYAGADLGVGAESIVQVTADDGAGQLAQLDLNPKVAWPGVLTAKFDPGDQPVDPGTTAVTYVTVVNRDTVPHTFQPQAYMDQDAPFTYKMPNLLEKVTLQPGKGTQFKFGLKPHPGTPAGARGKVVFEAYLSNDLAASSAAVTSDQAFAVLAERYRVAVSTDRAEQQPAWSETVSYTLSITNTGSLEGDVDWTVSNGPEHFKATTDKPKVPPHLKPGEAVQIQVGIDPVFAGWFDYFNTVTQRFHAMTDEDKAQFSAFVRDRDVTTTTVKLGDASAEAEVTTLRPKRPDYPLPTPTTGNAVASPAGHGPHSPDGFTCGVCHTAHGSPMPDTPDQSSQLLLASTTRALCDTCHDGTGSIYNVEAGLIDGGYPSSSGPLKQPGEPDPVTTGFLFGTKNYQANKTIVSFISANPAHRDISIPGAPAISAHPLEQQATPAGGDGLTGMLTCTSCHDPHGMTDNSRLVSINFGGQKVDVPFKAAYSQSPNEHLNLISGSVDVCRACHMSIDNHGALGPLKIEDNPDLGQPWNIFQARSAGWLPLESEEKAPAQHVVCLTCHTAHGSRTDLPGHFEKLMRDPFVGIEEKYGNWCAACHDL